MNQRFVIIELSLQLHVPVIQNLLTSKKCIRLPQKTPRCLTRNFHNICIFYLRYFKQQIVNVFAEYKVKASQ